jgi:serine/threonine protein kinase
MDAERWRRLKELFDAAADLSPAEQEDLVARECVDDAELRAELMRVLRADALNSVTNLPLSTEADMVDELARGERIDHFEVVRLVGRGGMGAVYLARDTTLGRKVALKLLASARSPQAVERLIAEARTTAKFNHPNIVTVHAVGITDRGLPYLALEYLEGENLASRIAEQPPTVREAIRLGLDVARAVEEAHRHDVVHGDLKPANVVIGKDGRVRVVDFGLAQEIIPETTHLAAAHQQAGVVGTPAYLAPEQWRLERSSKQTDVWALGIVLFELCAHALPWEIGNGGSRAQRGFLEVAELVLAEMPMIRLDSVAAVPDELSQLVARCFDKHPQSRPSISDVVQALDAMLSHPAGERDSPFRGLLPFTDRHAALFFGREAEVALSVERLRSEPLLLVVGPSGAGKSSFVQAGLIPRLREQRRWITLTVRPGSEPFRALAARIVRRANDDSQSLEEAAADSELHPELAVQLRESPGRLALELRRLAREEQAHVVLFVDQLEELFTLGADDRDQQQYLRALAGASYDRSEPVRVVITVRDDFLGRIAVDEAVRNALSRVLLLQRLDSEALKRTLVAPLEAVRHRYEDAALVDEMVDAVRGEPACLPLLQFTAERLWQQADHERRIILRGSYAKIGGVAGALAQHADGVLGALAEDELKLARQLLLRLVTSERTRRVISRDRALEGLPDRASEVLSRLVAARLVTTSRRHALEGEGAMLELAHESLIRSWKTLAHWISESEEELALATQVDQAAELWERRGKRGEELWEGDALADALRRLEGTSTALGVTAREFLTASRARVQRIARRRRLLLAGAMASLTTIATAAVVATVYIADKEREARRQTERAEKREAELQRRRAEGLREAAESAFDRGELLDARAQLRASLELEDSAASRALWWRMRREPLAWSLAASHQVWRVAFSPDGRHIAAAANGESRVM